MALSPRLRDAFERQRRASALPGYLEGVRAATGLVLTGADLLDDEARETLVERTRAASGQAMASGTERRTAGLSADEARHLARRIAAQIPDVPVLVGFGSDVPALARLSLHAVLDRLDRAVSVGGFVGITAEDGRSRLAVDRLDPGDYGNQHPEGSYEFIVYGPLFERLDLPDLVTFPPRPQAARTLEAIAASRAQTLGPKPGRLPG
ncbi:MAG: hypothetical protein IPG17_29285 [Sandaracinaceae bacterium]|nr:hypothetical protein [Sandaracinaceae bacterium]